MKMNQLKINLALSTQQVEIILGGLAELPLKIGGDLFQALKQEAANQITAANAPAKKEKKAAKKVDAPADAPAATQSVEKDSAK